MLNFLMNKMARKESFFLTVSGKQPKMKHSRYTKEVFVTNLLHNGTILEITFKVKLGMPKGIEPHAKLSTRVKHFLEGVEK